MVDIIEITLTLLIFIVEKCNLHIWKGEKNRVLFVMSIWLYHIFDTIDFRSKNNQSFSFGITTLTVYIDFICLILHMYFFFYQLFIILFAISGILKTLLCIKSF